MGKYCAQSSSGRHKCDTSEWNGASGFRCSVFAFNRRVKVAHTLTTTTATLERIWSKQGRNWTIFGWFFSPLLLLLLCFVQLVVYHYLFIMHCTQSLGALVAWRQMFVSFCSAHRQNKVRAHETQWTIFYSSALLSVDVFVSSDKRVLLLFNRIYDDIRCARCGF